MIAHNATSSLSLLNLVLINHDIADQIQKK
jgi:hypothetical protein